MLDEKKCWENLLPFTWLRPWYLSWVGSVRLVDLWKIATGQSVYISVPDYLRVLVPEEYAIDESRGGAGTQTIIDKPAFPIDKEQIITATHIWEWVANLNKLLDALVNLVLPVYVTSGKLYRVNRSEGFFLWGKNLWVGRNVKIRGAFLNTEEGPIIIDEGSEVMEGSMIRGPAWVGPGSQIKMGAKLYGPVIIGPVCKVGGEVTWTWIESYTNKAHDGFIGHAIIGRWCNIGADTNNSNLKNNYATVKVWDYSQGKFTNTGLQFCGLFMADHSRTGINTMLNTGTVMGPFANVFGGGFPRTFIPPFSWGGASGFQTFRLDKAIEMAQRMMARRNKSLTNQERYVIEHAFKQSARWRWWETQE